MQDDSGALADGAQMGVGMTAHEPLAWRAQWTLEKRHGDWTAEQIDAGAAPAPYEIVDIPGNLLTYGGGSILFGLLIGEALTNFSNANAYIGVGDSSTAAAATQTDLQAASNKLRKAMDATYPQHTDGTGASTNAQVVFRSTFGTSDANFAWNEWAVFNASTSGRMLNRRVESLGTKTSAGTWTLTCTLSLS